MWVNIQIPSLFLGEMSLETDNSHACKTLFRFSLP